MCGLALLMMVALAVVVAPGARAYGRANWQAAFAGTTVVPGALIGFPGVGAVSSGFWGWCDFAGVSSGAAGDCEVSNYFHFSAPSLGLISITCTVSLDITSWNVQQSPAPPAGTGLRDFFIISGTVNVNPQSSVCLAIFATPPVGDTFIPAAPIHFNTNQAMFTLPGQFQVTVTQVP